MVYIFAFFGFMIGFAIGLGVTNVALRTKTIEEIKSKPSYKWTFGLLVWAFGFLGAWLGVFIFNNYF